VRSTPGTYDERSLLLSFKATDPESGIQRLGLGGTTNVCDPAGVLVDYQDSHRRPTRQGT
jgi:hypothetical protein